MKTIKNNKKGYKIGGFIEKGELEKVATGITLKALKVIEASGNAWASRIIEHKDIDTLEDLKQTVILVLLENNLQITKECFRIVNKYMYNYKIDRVKNMEIIINDDDGVSNLDKNSYVNYIKEEVNSINRKEEQKNFNISMLNLTDKQKEILNVFSKMGTFGKTAEILGVSKSTVQKTIERIRTKTQKIIECIEY